jgi:TRAP-type C4-dicarboxylate transport system permease large subunit
MLPTHVILSLMLGLLTLPVGMVLYVMSKVYGVKFEQCVIATAPLYRAATAGGLGHDQLFFPGIAMWLPDVAYRGN